jgi:glycosyltransferase involved in cell wall biosynthesis
VTYVARNLEPYRGFHIFMRALEKLQQQHRGVHAVIVGGDEVSYGKRPTDAKTWREKMLREVKLDAARTHFMGKLPRAQYIKVLQLSAAHVYLTYPFVLSWSQLEAMACGANIVASDTAPVREVIRDGVNGVLVPFFDANQVAERVEFSIARRAQRSALAQGATRTAQAFSFARGAAGYEELMVGSNTFGGRIDGHLLSNQGRIATKKTEKSTWLV